MNTAVTRNFSPSYAKGLALRTLEFMLVLGSSKNKTLTSTDVEINDLINKDIFLMGRR